MLAYVKVHTIKNRKFPRLKQTTFMHVKTKKIIQTLHLLALINTNIISFQTRFRTNVQPFTRRADDKQSFDGEKSINKGSGLYSKFNRERKKANYLHFQRAR